MWTPLHTAARDGDTARLRRCVESIKWREPVDVNSESTDPTIPHGKPGNGLVEDPPGRDTPLHVPSSWDTSVALHVLVASSYAQGGAHQESARYGAGTGPPIGCILVPPCSPLPKPLPTPSWWNWDGISTLLILFKTFPLCSEAVGVQGWEEGLVREFCNRPDEWNGVSGFGFLGGTHQRPARHRAASTHTTGRRARTDAFWEPDSPVPGPDPTPRA